MYVSFWPMISLRSPDDDFIGNRRGLGGGGGNSVLKKLVNKRMERH